MPWQGLRKAGIGEDERRRDEALAQQALLAVGVGEDGVEQPGPLDERRLERAPLAAGEDERDEVDLPSLSGRGRVGEDVVRDAHLAHAPVEAVGALRLLGGGQSAECGEERLPVRPNVAVSVDKFVVAAAAQARVAREQAPVELERRAALPGSWFQGRAAMPRGVRIVTGLAVRCRRAG